MADAPLIRAPRPPDREACAELILQSDCGTLPALFGARVRPLLEYLFGLSGNPYSAANELVAVEGSASIVIAAAVGSLASAARAAELQTAAQLARWYGLSFVTRLPRLARAGRSQSGLAPHDFYLAHIAVMPDRRGRGIGARLLDAVEDRARSRGARRVVLDVDEHNVRAQAFYERRGYRGESVVRIDLGRHGTFTLRRLARDL